MIHVDLQHRLRLGAVLPGHPVQHLLHAKRERSLGRQAHRVVAEPFGEAHRMRGVADAVFHEFQDFFVLFVLTLDALLVLVGREPLGVGADVGEGLAVVFAEHLQSELVHVVGQIQDFIAVCNRRLHLRQERDLLDRLAGGEVDFGLPLRHARDILLQRHVLLLLGGHEEQQILERVLVRAVFLIDAVLELEPERTVKFFIRLPLVLEHFLQLGRNLALHPFGDGAELAIVLEHLTRDVEREVGAVHEPAHEAEIVGEQILALVHDQDAGGVELEPLLEVAAVIVIRRVLRDEEQRLVGRPALGFLADDLQGCLEVEELLAVESRIFFLRHLRGGALPDRRHAVERAILRHRFIGVVGALFETLFRHLHFDGVTNVVAVFLHELDETVALEILAVLLLFGIRLEVQRHDRTDPCLLAGLDRVAVHPGGFPAPCLLGALRAALDDDALRHHEGGVEAHAELPDDIHILVLFFGLLERERTALRDGAEIALEFFARHAAAVVGDGQRPLFLICRETDDQILALYGDARVGERPIVQFVAGVARIGDELPQKNFLVRVDGIDHHLQQFFGFCFELFLCHDRYSFLPIGGQSDTKMKTNRVCRKSARPGSPRRTREGHGAAFRLRADECRRLGVRSSRRGAPTSRRRLFLPP